jgi:hypothetical protein
MAWVDRRHQQMVAVGRRLCDVGGAGVAAGAGPVLHHELLAQQLAHLGAHDACYDVGWAAGRERHHHPHRL